LAEAAAVEAAAVDLAAGAAVDLASAAQAEPA